MAGRLLLGPQVLVVALVVALVLLPPAAAVPFTGPGQAGLVPVGDGGHTATLPVALAGPARDNATIVYLDSVPADVCRIVLDGNGTNRESRLVWLAGRAPAIYASAAVVDAPFKVHAAWHRDINGRCTAEETEARTIWHDPRGRPFIELSVVDERPSYAPKAGTTERIVIEVYNNGTIGDNVTARVVTLRDGWKASADGPTNAVQVPPLQTVTFAFQVTIPFDEPSRLSIANIALTSETGWAEDAQAILRTKADPNAPKPSTEPDPTQFPRTTPTQMAEVPKWTPQAAEAPGLPVVLFAALAVALAALLRRHV